VSTDLQTVESGEGDERVVFVHGVLDRGRSFRFVADELASECRLTWYDRRGYGDSLDATAEAVGVDVHAQDLLGVLDGRPAVVVGHSFGGVTVLKAAISAPELVRAVVIYETGMAWAPGWDDGHMQAMLWGEDPEGSGARMMFGSRFEAMDADERTRWLLESRAFIGEERSVRRGPAPFDLSTLQVPLVYGCSDEARFGVVSTYLMASVPDVEIVELPGAGHNAHRTQPGPFADLVRRAITLAADRS
jgi:pimeloyl-ACP methyl ester carboxylesterase